MKKTFLTFTAIVIFAFILSSSSCKDKTSNSSNQDSTIVNTNNSVNNNNGTTNNNTVTGTTSGEVIMLDSQGFIDNVFDFENNQDWVYAGNLPCIVDFYADWCGPCKMVAPIMDELAKEYKDKIIFYKVNVDNAQDAAAAFGIQSIPSVLFVPVTGDPQMSTGAMQKEGYVNAINQILFGQN